ncbi:MAG: tRNA (N(6)-L-threonylcarbamoyladenosine(37)-C(2))-methylthiotransferase MtaB [Leptospirales bacterium]|nr:tRNA (N(6)-L-threonylcarbamoyladenosine(37)-C(2))-methylthiotransferase MtaB [Leptospirales bacterium]
MNPIAAPSLARPLRVLIETLGCRLNQFESDGLLRRFAASGRYLPAEEDASDIDLAILNSCTVTDQADARNRASLRSLRRRYPGARIVATGCYAQTDSETVAALPEVDLVVGNDRKSQLFEIVDRWLLDGAEAAATDLLEDPSRDPIKQRSQNGYGRRPTMIAPFDYGSKLPLTHTRAYLKIQDGCDRRCSYCKIPQARGPGVSRPAQDCIDHARALEDAGVAEIVLTGVNLGWYRDRSESLRFVKLLERVLDSLKKARLRLSSIEPCDIDADLARLSLHPQFCDFLHAPLQSGSDRILRAMRRSYSSKSFRLRIETFLKINPRVFLGSDVIVGFPGETAEDFRESYDLLEELGFANIHAFRFSPRSGAPAAELGLPRVPDQEIRQRMGKLAALRDRNFQSYWEQERGQRREMIVEQISPTGEFCLGLTDNFLRVIARKSGARRGQILPVEIGDRWIENRIECRLIDESI